MKIKKGDQVQVVRGKDKGKKGAVERVLPKENKVLVTNVNQYKRHMKARSQKEQSEIITLTKPLAVGNVMLICPKCHSATRVGFHVEKSREGRGSKKSRICKKCDSAI